MQHINYLLDVFFWPLLGGNGQVPFSGITDLTMAFIWPCRGQTVVFYIMWSWFWFCLLLEFQNFQSSKTEHQLSNEGDFPPWLMMGDVSDKQANQLFNSLRSGEFRYRFKESRESGGLINGRNIHVFDGN